MKEYKLPKPKIIRSAIFPSICPLEYEFHQINSWLTNWETLVFIYNLN